MSSSLLLRFAAVIVCLLCWCLPSHAQAGSLLQDGVPLLSKPAGAFSYYYIQLYTLFEARGIDVRTMAANNVTLPPLVMAYTNVTGGFSSSSSSWETMPRFYVNFDGSSPPTPQNFLYSSSSGVLTLQPEVFAGQPFVMLGVDLGDAFVPGRSAFTIVLQLFESITISHCWPQVLASRPLFSPNTQMTVHAPGVAPEWWLSFQIRVFNYSSETGTELLVGLEPAPTRGTSAWTVWGGDVLQVNGTDRLFPPSGTFYLNVDNEDAHMVGNTFVLLIKGAGCDADVEDMENSAEKIGESKRREEHTHEGGIALA